MDTQTNKILEHLLTKKSLTAIEALQKFGCFRLAARISDLRDRGYEIETTMMTRKNEDGKTVKFASYSLRGDEK